MNPRPIIAASLLVSFFASAESVPLGESLQPVPTHAAFREKGFHVWGASMVRDQDGTCHLFYSRWPEERGHHNWGSRSEIARATSKNPTGPYTPTGVVLPARGEEFWDGDCTHNPTIHHFDGKYYLYYMGTVASEDDVPRKLSRPHRNNQRIGVAVADSPEGPWKRFDKPVIDVTPDDDAHDAVMVANPSITRRPDGSYLMVYKAVAKRHPAPMFGPVVHLTATSDSPTGPFTKQNKPVFTAGEAKFPAEDPFIWYEGGSYRAIVKDMHGAFTSAGQSLVTFESADGFDWKPANPTLLTALSLEWTDGKRHQYTALERPQLWIENGKPSVLFCAASVDKERDDTLNIAIPLTPQKEKVDEE